MPLDVEIRCCATLREARTLALVLIAQNIPCALSEDEEGFGLHVAAEDLERARSELSAYQAENRRPPEGPDNVSSRTAASPLASAIGVASYAMVLLGVFGLQRRHSFGFDWTQIGAAQIGMIRDGALWRAATALTLHADLGHLLGNLAFGIVAGAMVAAQFGAGLGWLAIVLAGVLGNLANAVLQDSGHTAVGASTAVFGALGFLAGAAQRARRHRWRLGLRRWSPVAAGAMLLAFLGFGGERTDIGAHVAGFAVGVGLGFVVTRLSRDRLDNTRLQWACAAAAILIPLASWAAALGL